MLSCDKFEGVRALWPLQPYRHAWLVREWLADQGQRISLHFVPTYSTHLSPIERLWDAMHRNVAHNRSYPSLRAFKAATMAFLTKAVPTGYISNILNERSPGTANWCAQRKYHLTTGKVPFLAYDNN